MRLALLVTFVTVLLIKERVDGCTDLMSLDAKSTVNHGMRTTPIGDSKTGLILHEMISESDNNVYFVHIIPVCKIGNNYKYNCLVIKTFASYNELKTMNSRPCWEKQVRIAARCRLPTILIANGAIYCELEADKSNKKPRIAKINLSTGIILKTVVLSKAKDTSNCLKPRESFWNSGCSGQISDLTVRTFVDQNRFYVLYQSQSNSGQSILEERKLSDLASVSEKTVEGIDLKSKVLMICSKLYVIPVSANKQAITVTRFIDVANNKNKMTYPVKLADNLVNGIGSWFQYNPKRTELFIGRSDTDTIVYKVLKCRNSYGDTSSMDFTQLKSTFMWSMVSSENAHEEAMIDSTNSYFKITDLTTLGKISNALMTCPPKREVCGEINNPNQRYCRIKDIAISVDTYYNFKKNAGKENKQRLQNGDVELRKLLQQQNFQTMTHKLNNIQGFVSKNFNELKNQIASFREDLGSYFSSLANFDKKKAILDIKNINKALNSSSEQEQKYSKLMWSTLGELFAAAGGAVATEIAGQAVYVGFAISGFGEPFGAFCQRSVAMLNLMRALGKLATALAQIPRLANMKYQMTRLEGMAKEFKQRAESFQSKYVVITKLIRKAIKKELTLEDISKYSVDFMNEYEKFKSPYDPIAVTKYHAILKGIANNLCDIVFRGTTTATSVVKGTVYGRGDCVDIYTEIEALIATYKTNTKKHASLLESFVSAIRATIAYEKAEQIKKSKIVVSKEAIAENHLNLKLFALELFVSSQVHRLQLVHTACAVVQYKNAGLIPKVCKSAFLNPQGGSFDKLVAARFDKDMCSGDDINKFVHIPAVIRFPNTTIPKGTIDLSSLYKGYKTYFTIPNRKYMVDNDWINEEDKHKLTVLKSFELYLPLLQDTSSPTPVTVNTAFSFEGNNYITSGGVLYDFTSPTKYVYNFRYSQNQRSCANEKASPYQLPGCNKIPGTCFISAGTVEDTSIYPSVFSRWGIKATVAGNLKRPDPKEILYLVAKIRLCFVDPVETFKRSDKKRNKEKNGETARRSMTCCGNKSEQMYFDHVHHECKKCPSGSISGLDGLYCQIQPNKNS